MAGLLVAAGVDGEARNVGSFARGRSPTWSGSVLVFVCADGVVRVSDGGGVSTFANLQDIAGADPAECVELAMTVDRVLRALDGINMPWWRRPLRLRRR